MTPAIAMFLAICSLPALGLVGAISALLGLMIHDAVVRAIRWVLA